ncbi:MAG: amidohydrolase [Flavobacteriaceae bacterium]
MTPAAEPAPFIDSHFYIVDPARFPFAPGRQGYQPKPHEIGQVDDYVARMDGRGIARAVAIQPSPYAFDSSPVVDAVTRHGGRLRAVGVFPSETPAAALAALKERGIVGARFNIADFQRDALAGPAAERYLAVLAELGLFAEIYALPEQWPDLYEVVRRSGVRVVIDHFGCGNDRQLNPVLATRGHLERLADLGDSYVKLTSANRLSHKPETFDDLDPVVGMLRDLFGPDRMLWGSGWPFLNAPRPVTYEVLTGNFRRWFPDEADRRRILGDVPARLFSFGV